MSHIRAFGMLVHEKKIF